MTVRDTGYGVRDAGTCAGWMLALLLLTVPAAAQSARLTVLADSVSAGMPFEVAVAVTHGPGRQVTFPPVPAGAPEAGVLALGDAEALSVRRLPPTARGRVRVDSAVYRVVVFTADSARVGPAEVLLAPGDTVATGSDLVPVRSVLTGEAAPYEPAPIGPAEAFPSAVPLWIGLGLLALLIVGGAVWGVGRALRRRPEAGQTVTPYAAAVARLDALALDAPSADATPGAIETHVVAVRDALRIYLAARLGVPAQEATSTEIVRHLANDARVPAVAVEAVRKALRPTDLVAFARVRPAPDAVGRLRDATRQAVEQVESGVRRQESEAAQPGTETTPSTPSQP